MSKFLFFILKQLSQLIIWRFKPKIIAITGSVGKTSAKEAIFAALKDKRRARKSISGLNTVLGLPLSIIGDEQDFSEEKLKLVAPHSFFVDSKEKKNKIINKISKLIFWLRVILLGVYRIIFLRKNKSKNRYPEILILEYGVDCPGEMDILLGIAKPEIGVMTAIGDIPAHVEFFSGSDDPAGAVFAEKAKLIESLPSNGFAILNADNEKIMNLKNKTRAKVISFGFSNSADVKIWRNTSLISRETLIGDAHLYAAAIGAAAGIACRLSLFEIVESFTKNYKPIKGRANLILGKNNIRIIDDSYNASPASVELALKTLSNMNEIFGKRKIAILGDMLELGKFSEEGHRRIGRKAAAVVDILITVGNLAKIITEEAEKSGLDKSKIFTFDSAETTLANIDKIIQSNDIILIKASRGIGLNKIVDALVISARTGIQLVPSP